MRQPSENPPPSTSLHTVPAKGPNSNQSEGAKALKAGTLASHSADQEGLHTKAPP